LNWFALFQSEFEQIGNFIKKHNIRISIHPDQFVILNSLNTNIIKSSINELKYHCNVLDAMRLDETAKVQTHVGGVYGNKIKAINRFVRTYDDISRFVDEIIGRGLVIAAVKLFRSIYSGPWYNNISNSNGEKIFKKT
jgi:UV DNA damage endonuclease